MGRSRCWSGRRDGLRLLCEGRKNTGDLRRRSKVPKPQVIEIVRYSLLMSHVKTMTMNSKSRGRVATTFLNLLQLKTCSFHSLTWFCCLKKESIKSYFGLILEVAQVSRGCGAGGTFSTQGKRKRQDIVNFTSC